MPIKEKPPGASGPSSPAEDSVDALVDAGRYDEAASLAKDSGDYLQATQLFERVWDFGRAKECAELAGDNKRALRNAIDAKQPDDVDRLVSKLKAGGEQGQRDALSVLVERRSFARAAPIAELLGETDKAIDYFREAQLLLDAARLLSAAGRDNEAGRTLERIATQTDLPDESAEANLRLGRILARRMRHDDAVKHLQRATSYEGTRDEAYRLLIVELAALGLRDAARDALIAARRFDDTLATDVDEVIRSERPKEAATENRVIGGRYRLGDLLGAGGAGRVYHAFDEVSGIDVAIKLFSTAHAHGHEGFERFVREARIASTLKHPNLVEAFDFSADHGFLVMELMSGGSLARRIPPRLTQVAVRRLVLELLDGLELAHRRGIIHRDIKPANIFFDARGTAKLGDFGVAHLLDLGQTQTGGLIGTLAYMSPEQITGAPLTITADLYALGVTVFEALTGRLPFLGPDFVAEHLGAPRPKPSAFVEDIATEWDELSDRLLAKSPDDRFDSVDAVRQALHDLEFSKDENQPLILPRATARARPLEPSEPAQQAPAPEEEAPKERYEFETKFGKTGHSTLSRAVDRALGRSVIVERFDKIDEPSEARLYALARGGGPFLQRALGYDRSSHVAIFEAPSGSPISELTGSFAPSHRALSKLLKRLARALAPLHHAGHAHGALSDKTVLIDDWGYPAVMVSGIGPAPDRMSAELDIEACLGLVADQLRVDATLPLILSALLDNDGSDELNRLQSQGLPKNGEELYELSEAIEFALLRRSANEVR